ncbi:hypothetical protein C8D87_11611 [Lentzea atacamensis]|uniref:ATP-binding protein n=1 Tax=Lentzea atacamensis TaxID=531938 RepID=A0ABX9DV50_9PSEU|nr:hypothetical protein [Lentzea atacamensis]RAS58958.1 hypothetical protein C8D87_11611 [Lentzea atacamensis]
MISPDTYFGEADAATASTTTLTAHHVFRSIEDRLKWRTAASGVQVIVGVKGSGKTDLRRYLATTDQIATLNLDADHAYLGLNAATVKESSGRTKNAIATVLLREFAHRISESAPAGNATARKLKAALDASTATLRRVTGAMDVSIAGINLRLADLLKREEGNLVQVAIEKLMADVLAALESKRGAIMIDDVEDVFPGTIENPLFLEGVVRAVSDINTRGKDRVHVLLFVKHGLWRSWYENQREYDRVRHAIGFLSWDHQALIELVARRIAYREGIDIGPGDLDVSSLWARKFTWTGDPEIFMRYCTQYCVSGPRDMITLCNLAAARAGRERIGQQHLAACLGDFAQDKVYNLNADYGDTYPNISQFVEKVFQGVAATMTGADLAQLMDSRALLVPSVDEQFRHLRWYSTATRERLATIMYEIGVIGYESPQGRIHAIEDRSLPTADLLSKEAISVHPAFRPHLAIGP